MKPEKVYKTEKSADISTSPVPDYRLLSMKDYVTMNIQVSRGCPLFCDFCDQYPENTELEKSTWL
jgi:radical SAM superfamily enzyme YgiQ (UPF0313 family)